MTNNQNIKPAYDLEERTYLFAKKVRIFIKTLPRTIANIEDSKQRNECQMQRRDPIISPFELANVPRNK